MRPEAKHKRRLDTSQDRGDHLQVRGDVPPGRHGRLVEEFQAALVAHRCDLSGDVLEALAKPQVVIPYPERVQFAARDRAAAGEASDGGPMDRVGIAIADPEVAEHAPAAR